MSDSEKRPPARPVLREDLKRILSSHYAVNEKLEGAVDDLVKQIMNAYARQWP